MEEEGGGAMQKRGAKGRGEEGGLGKKGAIWFNTKDPKQRRTLVKGVKLAL